MSNTTPARRRGFGRLAAGVGMGLYFAGAFGSLPAYAQEQKAMTSAVLRRNGVRPARPRTSVVRVFRHSVQRPYSLRERRPA